MTLLRIDASARTEGSVSRALADQAQLALADGDVLRRDLAGTPLPQIDAFWAAARLVAAEDRSADEAAALSLSDDLVAELQAADTVLISSPVYNFGLPAALKAWIDLVARPKVTFAYTADGPVGLLSGKRAVIVMASGGTQIEGPGDFATPHLRHVLAFLGITDVTVVASEADLQKLAHRDAA